MTPELTQHPTLPDWQFREYEHNDGSHVFIVRDGYRHDTPDDEPLISVRSTQKTATSQQFVMYARKWDQDHGMKHNHIRKKRAA